MEVGFNAYEVVQEKMMSIACSLNN